MNCSKKEHSLVCKLKWNCYNRLKIQYKYSKASGDAYCSHVFYPFLRSYVHKKFGPRQEKSFHYLHRIEYKEYFLNLIVARGKQFAEPWDDYWFHRYDVAGR